MKRPPQSARDAARAGRQGAAGPIQQSIEASPRERAEVALHVQFRTGSAEVDPEALPLLEELRATLGPDAHLNLAVIGPTDNVGTGACNLTFSYRRAEAVRTWLARHGISPTRMVLDGRGFDDPLADNATEAGRASNRRVQAKRI